MVKLGMRFDLRPAYALVERAPQLDFFFFDSNVDRRWLSDSVAVNL